MKASRTFPACSKDQGMLRVEAQGGFFAGLDKGSATGSQNPRDKSTLPWPTSLGIFAQCMWQFSNQPEPGAHSSRKCWGISTLQLFLSNAVFEYWGWYSRGTSGSAWGQTQSKDKQHKIRTNTSYPQKGAVSIEYITSKSFFRLLLLQNYNLN